MMAMVDALPRPEDIHAYLPHRGMMLLLDRVLELDPGRSGRAVKDIRTDDPFLAGHFPGDPIYPGVMLVEACAQLTAVICAAARTPDAAGSRLPLREYIASINRFKLIEKVRPGDRLMLSARIGKRVGNMLQALIAVEVRGRAIADGEIFVTSSDHGVGSAT
jgi:3-hydroxyacyl-[acyl-carrier-protein] dehydratase